MKNLFSWIRYSGITVRLNLNPFHWSYLGGFGKDFRGEWAGPNEKGWYVKFLFLNSITNHTLINSLFITTS